VSGTKCFRVRRKALGKGSRDPGHKRKMSPAIAPQKREAKLTDLKRGEYPGEKQDRNVGNAEWSP